EERNSLKNAVQIRERAFEAYQRLYARSGSLMEGFAEVRKAVEYLASANSKFAGLKENLGEVLYRVEDLSIALRQVAESFHSDPARLEQIEDRLALIRRLKKKYGTDVPGLIDYLHAASQQEGAVLDARSAVRKLKAEVEGGRTEYLRSARELSAARRSAAERLEAAMKVELKDLAMPEASFIVSFQELEASSYSPAGLEKVEFYLAANPGEDARPLARVASGGELSRIMLALKALQFDSQGARTVIFDEVDAGIGGHTAAAVGTRLSRVARLYQVICVTHLHQIAALADHHLSVIKSVDQGRTYISVTALDREQRVEELSRMLGASAESDAVREHVTRLMDQHTAEVSG
ncbi:MAG: DNA repair protein RecN, partial [Deltaproteobacteria bacterium]|nr:DNA repair protein RecN [Deltaproteobacteria bacterium]